MGLSDIPKSAHYCHPAGTRDVSQQRRTVCDQPYLIARKNERILSILRRCDTGMDYLEIIQSIDVPLGWEQDTSDGELSIPGVVVSKFYSPDATMWIGISTLAMSARPNEECARYFRKSLAAPPHVLSRTDIDELQGVLETLSDPKDFRITDSRTVDWNGKRAVLIEGQWISKPRDGKVLIHGHAINHSPRDEFSLFVDVRGDGLDPLKIQFSAPHDVYSKFSPLGKAAIKTIKWKARKNK